MKKRLSLIIAAVLCLIAAMTMTVAADEPADSSDKIGKMTVVYLRDNGTGDGSDYANAVGTLEDAYMMLDLSKDCTIVVCDKFTQINPDFNIGEENKYTGKVTITSCYGGYDYRTIGAKFEFDPFRFHCWGETAFEYIEFYTPKTNMLVFGQHNPVTVGEEVKISGDQMTGGTVAKAFCIVGGWQKPRTNSTAVVPMEDNRDTNITVMSGEFIYIIPFSRELGGNTYMGTAHVKVGGNAKVSVLHGTAVGTNTFVGNLDLEITDNAYIKNFYGSTNPGVVVKSVNMNWKSGTIDAFYWECPYTSSASELSVEGTTTLNSSDSVKALAGYAKIATLFDSVGKVAQDAAYAPEANPNTQKPGNDILKAPTTTKTPTPPAVIDPDDTDPADTEPNQPVFTRPADDDDDQPVFTRAPRDSGEASTPGDSAATGGDNADGGNNTIIIIIAAAAGVAVIGAVTVILLLKKKRS